MEAQIAQMEAQVAQWVPYVFFVGLFIFLLFGIIKSICAYHGRCVKCRKFRRKHDEYWIEERTEDNHFKGYTIYWCKRCRWTVPPEFELMADREKYFKELFKKNILPQKLKNKNMRKWIINIFLVVLFYEILSVTPRLLDKLLN